MATEQEIFWKGSFGEAYTDRNSRPFDEWAQFYLDNFGITKIDMNKDCFNQVTDITEASSVLEVGCNSGMQLVGLQTMGFKKLFGVELQEYAVQKAKEYTHNINIVQGTGFDIPFKDQLFDIVCTNGVLIHIAPEDLPAIMKEIYRSSKKYIWGFEYFSEEINPITYRDNIGYLWKANYADIYLTNFPDLKLVYKRFYPYVNKKEENNMDCMFLLEKI